MRHSLIPFFSSFAKNRLCSSVLLGLTTCVVALLVIGPTLGNAKDAASIRKSRALSAVAAKAVPSRVSIGFPVASSAQAPATNVSTRSQQISAPNALQTVLYDQTDNPSGAGTNSQNFEAANDAFDDQVADDFVVPAGGWTIGQVNVGGVYFNGAGPANSVNVFFYADAATLPGAAVAGGTYLNVPITSGAASGSFHIVLPTTLTLAPGTYWVSVQANMDFGVGGQWAWNDRTVQSNSGAAFQNPGGGFACSGGNSWVRKPTCVTGAAPDNIFQLLTAPAVPPCPVCPPYTTTTSTGNAIVPGTTDIGNHTDDGTTDIALPFPVTLFGTTYTTGTLVHALSNGSLEFGAATAPFGTACPLPDPNINQAILAFQGDLRTDNTTLTGEGIFTSITGSAPNRNFNIEWRAEEFSDGSGVNFEIVLHENSNCFDVIYGVTSDSGATHESGVQKGPAGPAAQFSCNAATLTSGLKVTYCPNNCPAPAPTSAVSRKVHGAAGTFDIPLPLVPLNGAVGVECRQQGAGTGASYWLNVTVMGNGSGRAFDSQTSGANAIGLPPGNDLNAFFNSAQFGNVFTPTSDPAIGQAADFSMGIKGPSGILWYNGDFNNVNGLANEINTSLGQSSTYDNFIVPAGPGFDITSVFSDNLTDTVITGASWEIRSGVSAGNGGTLVASGSTTTPIVTPTGRSGFGFTEYQVEVPVSPTLHLAPVLGFSHQIVVTFPGPIELDTVAVTAGTGSVSSYNVSGGVVTINLTGVTNGQRLGVTLKNVCNGTIAGDVLIPMGVLVGDSNGNGSVNAADISQTKTRSGQLVGGANFRSDVNANGSINAGDITSTKIRSGTSLP
jgi:hypothetical protein